MVEKDLAERLNVHQTARQSAALRAAHCLHGEEPKIFEDTLALGLSGSAQAEVTAMIGRVPGASASSCILRSRYTEDRLAAARYRLDQYVLLGAGLDSYALRMGEALGSMRVYEVDDPPFLEWKRQRIAELGLVAPAQLRYAPCDFETTSIPQALAQTDFNSDTPCFVSWLGVTQYISQEATQATLRWAGSRPKGSEIVLTFLDNSARMEIVSGSLMDLVGELAYYTCEAMTDLLREAGFSTIEMLSEARANAMFFRYRKDGLVAPQIQRLMSATV
jgi:methyltransferase (TIGR00027 family)